jgi:hypothetical protein
MQDHIFHPSSVDINFPHFAYEIKILNHTPVATSIDPKFFFLKKKSSSINERRHDEKNQAEKEKKNTRKETKNI